jgi:putative sigma-54 modulation protein
MNIKIHSVRFDADEKLLGFVEERTGKLEVYYDDIIGVEVFLRLDKDTADRENKLVEIKLDIAGSTLFSKKQCKSFEEATDLAIEAIKKQLLKYKDKVRKN